MRTAVGLRIKRKDTRRKDVFDFDDNYANRLQHFRDHVKDKSTVEVIDLSSARLIIKIETGDHYMESWVIKQGAKCGIIPSNIKPSCEDVSIIFCPVEEYSELHLPDSGQTRGFQ